MRRSPIFDISQKSNKLRINLKKDLIVIKVGDLFDHTKDAFSFRE